MLSGLRFFRGLRRRRWLRLGADANLKRIDPDRVNDILKLRLAEVTDREVEPNPHLAIRIFRRTDGAGLGNTFKASSDVDAITHQIAVAFLDDVAQMNANAEFDATLGR